MEFVDVSVYPFFQRRGISVETMSTVRRGAPRPRVCDPPHRTVRANATRSQTHALATFNVLNGEGRGVAAALLSATPMPREEMYAYKSGLPPSGSDPAKSIA